MKCCTARRGRTVGLLLLLGLLLMGCPPPSGVAQSHLKNARERAASSSSAERVGELLLLELIAPKGSNKRAAKVREQLAKLKGKGSYASLARALDADEHGRFGEAAKQYVMLLDSLRDDPRADAHLLAWFASHRLLSLRTSVDGLWERSKDTIERVMNAPASIGWRARSTLVEWWAHELMRASAGKDAKALLSKVAERHGCLREALFAGPFGSGVMVDHRVHFAAEGPGPWPARLPLDARTPRRPVITASKDHACLVRSVRPGAAGVYYVQSFFELDSTREVTIAVQGAHAVFVDDVEVMRRETTDWGVWPRFGVGLRLGPGRHRVVARLLAGETSIRVLDRNGAALGVRGSADQTPAYVTLPPERLAEPNALAPFQRLAGVKPPRGVPAPKVEYDLKHPLRRYLASYLANADGQADLASVLLEPIAKNTKRATAITLAHQAVYVDGDPIFSPQVARDLARDLRRKAAERDPDLWAAQLWLTLERADKTTPAEVAKELEGLSQRFIEVPTIILRLASVYGRLGWTVEQNQALERAAKRFPNDIELLRALMKAYESHGQISRADAIAKRITALDPAEEVAFIRALACRDYDAAIAELRRVAKLSRNREQIAMRLANMLERAGKRSESLEKLRQALVQKPKDASARLALADARFARGDKGALAEALAEAIRVGADDAGLRNAIELVDGVTDLEPYRRNGLKLIKEAEQAGVKLPGRAARILDYSAIWVGKDGRARMLEHEIVRIQSRDGIQQHVEQNLPRGLVMRMRTIKADGRIFEPEIVSGKPTVTMPHLEVGDYYETEHLWMLNGPSDNGERFIAPRWYFREEGTSYLHSEVVMITPKGRQLDIEVTGSVPPPTLVTGPAFDVRSWKVTESPALVQEPFSAPIQEFLPSVRVGWGVDLDKQMRDIVVRRSRGITRDPRLLRIAATIVAGKLTEAKNLSRKMSADEKARRIYRWVVDTVQPGKEADGPKIVTGKSGDRTEAFVYLCQLLGIDARVGLVRDRLSPPVKGAFSRLEKYNSKAVRVAVKGGARWLVVGDRNVPYGFLPSSLRGQPAMIAQARRPLRSVTPPKVETEITAAAGSRNLVEHTGKVFLQQDGSAKIELQQRYHGRYAIQLRSMLLDVPASRRNEAVEARLLGLALPGGRIDKLEVKDLDELDKPVLLKMKIDVGGMARLGNGELDLGIPFLARLSRLVDLKSRQTPLYISGRVALRTELDLTIVPPTGAKLTSELEQLEIDDPRVHITVKDGEKNGTVRVRRSVEVSASRVQPGDYLAFKKQVDRGDAALNSRLRFKLAR